jgi:hypothetical protein
MVPRICHAGLSQDSDDLSGAKFIRRPPHQVLAGSDPLDAECRTHHLPASAEILPSVRSTISSAAVTAPGVLEDLFTRLRPVPSSVMNGYQNITAFHFFFVLLRFIFLHSHADQLMIAP